MTVRFKYVQVVPVMEIGIKFEKNAKRLIRNGNKYLRDVILILLPPLVALFTFERLLQHSRVFMFSTVKRLPILADFMFLHSLLSEKSIEHQSFEVNI